MIALAKSDSKVLFSNSFAGCFKNEFLRFTGSLPVGKIVDAVLHEAVEVEGACGAHPRVDADAEEATREEHDYLRAVDLCHLVNSDRPSVPRA